MRASPGRFTITECERILSGYGLRTRDTRAFDYEASVRHHLRTGFVFVAPALLASATTFENVALPIRDHETWTAARSAPAPVFTVEGAPPPCGCH